MHEHSIAAKIIAIVEEEITSASQGPVAGLVPAPVKVKRVTIAAGRTHAIVPESLAFHFDVLKKESPRLDSAELVVKAVSIVIECESCGKSAELEDAVFVCPSCNGHVRVLSGDELIVESIILEGVPEAH